MSSQEEEEEEEARMPTAIHEPAAPGEDTYSSSSSSEGEEDPPSWIQRTRWRIRRRLPGNNSFERGRFFKILGIVLVVFAIGGYVVAVVWNNSSGASRMDEEYPTYQEAFDQVQGLAYLYSRPEDLRNPKSGQAQAVGFLALDRARTPKRNLIIRELERDFLNRYIPAILFYASGDTSNLWLPWRESFRNDLLLNICQVLFQKQVLCENHSIVRLDFESLGLSGTIPPELGWLSALQSIELGDNVLYGTIPSQIGNLQQLTHLGLGRNGLQGPLPTTALGQLTNLRTVELDENPSLSGNLPMEWCFQDFSVPCSPIRINCDICETLISSAPTSSPSISMQPSAAAYFDYFDEILSLASNVSYEYLEDIHNNNTQSPQYRAVQWLAKERSELLMENNNVTSVTLPYDPEDVEDVIQRYVMAVLYYATLGEEWTEPLFFLSPHHHVCQWRNRKSIISSSNNILRFGIECNEEKHIVRIDMTANHLEGTIPQELSALTNLKVLDLAQNELSGDLPTEIARLTNLEILDLSNIRLTGQVPEEWTRLSHLERLHLQVNYLSGSVPTGFCEFEMSSGIWADCLDGSLSCDADCCERCYDHRGFNYEECSDSSKC